MGHSNVLIDSSIIISHFRRKRASSLLAAAEKFDEIQISAISAFKVDLGARIAGRESDLERVLPELRVLPITHETVTVAIDIIMDLRKKGRSIDLRDLFIAATTREHDLPLLTENEAHFQDIPGIKLVSI
jgi:tRNA(fMet)-specific endonuclease VapC